PQARRTVERGTRHQRAAGQREVRDAPMAPRRRATRGPVAPSPPTTQAGLAVPSPIMREDPDLPRVGVGAVVLNGERVLPVKRGGQPSTGKWSLPGGMVELGETTVEAVEREIAEECGLEIRVVGLAGVLDRVVKDAEGRIRYHWVLVD